MRGWEKDNRKNAAGGYAGGYGGNDEASERITRRTP